MTLQQDQPRTDNDERTALGICLLVYGNRLSVYVCVCVHYPLNTNGRYLLWSTHVSKCILDPRLGHFIGIWVGWGAS